MGGVAVFAVAAGAAAFAVIAAFAEVVEEAGGDAGAEGGMARS
ncbi:hypothetical protein [Streptomyces sp. SCSIO ZS0520]|nr:hypothetical protein [Streptomyces sp. SCSIO ZS0520]